MEFCLDQNKNSEKSIEIKIPKNPNGPLKLKKKISNKMEAFQNIKDNFQRTFCVTQCRKFGYHDSNPALHLQLLLNIIVHKHLMNPELCEFQSL